MKRLLTVMIFCAFFSMGAATQGGTIHTVQSGDTLSQIAARYMPYTTAYTKGELISSIKEINKITGPLSLGQSLSIPVVYNQPLKPRTMPKPKDFVAKGLYMNSSTSGTRLILDSAEQLRKWGGNTLVFDAKDDMGAITYHSPIPAKYCPNERYTPNIEELSKLIEYLHRMGIHVVARVVVFRDPIMSRSKPEWCINREKQWLDPANPEVQEYMLTVIREISESGLDEIQLDYVRYHADGKTTTGKDGVLRTDVIAGFLKKVHDITAPKGLLLSIDMFGIVIWQRDVDVLVVGQDIAKIKQHVDIISPMLYPSHFSAGFGGVKNPADDPYRFVSDGIERMKDFVGQDVVIRPWLQSFPLRVTRGFGPKYIRDQIDAARDAGGTGWLLWSPGNHYSDAYAAMQNLPKEMPEAKEAGSGITASEAKQPSSAKNVVPAEQPVAVGPMPEKSAISTGQPVGANSQPAAKPLSKAQPVGESRQPATRQIFWIGASPETL